MKGKLTKKIKGTTKRPRLAVFKSLKHISAQIIDDEQGKTLAFASTIEKGKKKASNNTVAAAKKIGEELAKKAIAAGIKKVVFDRAGNRYHGKIAALADAARAGGLDF
jgi:large subunit ribosomal protein L18